MDAPETPNSTISLRTSQAGRPTRLGPRLKPAKSRDLATVKLGLGIGAGVSGSRRLPRLIAVTQESSLLQKCKPHVCADLRAPDGLTPRQGRLTDTDRTGIRPDRPCLSCPHWSPRINVEATARVFGFGSCGVYLPRRVFWCSSPTQPGPLDLEEGVRVMPRNRLGLRKPHRHAKMSQRTATPNALAAIR